MKPITFTLLASALPLALVAGEQKTIEPPSILPAQANDAGSSGTAAAEASPDATLQLSGGSLAVGIGYVWGHGTVNFQGADHKFRIHGVSVADVGGASISATGAVTNLTNLTDFNGKYVAWSAGATVGDGGSAVYMKNEHGVVIKLTSTTVGLRFNLSGNGVTIKLES
jgi:hypothetical protein